MDELIHNLCCVSSPELNWCSLNKELHLEEGILAVCKIYCYEILSLNKEKAPRSACRHTRICYKV